MTEAMAADVIPAYLAESSVDGLIVQVIVADILGLQLVSRQCV